MRPSERRTTVAVLRNMLGLRIEDFAKLIDRSVPTIRTLESGGSQRLSLSEKTALAISKETGVAVEWLLAGDVAVQPYSALRSPAGDTLPYNKGIFEMIQAAKAKTGVSGFAAELSAAELQVEALRTNLDWFPILLSAHKRGEADIAIFIMNQHLREMARRWPKDCNAAAEVNGKARFITADSHAQYTFEYKEDSARLAEMAKERITVLKETEAARTHARPKSSYWWDPISVQTPSGVKTYEILRVDKDGSLNWIKRADALPEELIERVREGREGKFELNGQQYWIKPMSVAKAPSPKATAPTPQQAPSAPQPKVGPALSAKSLAQPDEGGTWGALVTAQRYCA